jgi:type II secretory pathway component PulM
MKALILRLKSVPHMSLILSVWALLLVGYLGSLLWDYQQQGEQQYQLAQKEWVWLQSQQPRVTVLRKHLPGKKEMEMPIEQVVMQSAKKKQLIVTQQKLENDRLSIVLEDVPFDEFVSWVAQLKKQYAINVLQLELSESPSLNGEVKVMKLTLGRLMEGVHV